jgi:hypothetical protein
MHRLRRGALVAAVTVLGTLALSGCRSQPSVAIYIGDTTYSQKRVERMATELQKLPSYTKADTRRLVAQWIVQRDVAKQMLTVRKIALPPTQSDEISKESGLPANSELVRLYAEFRAYDAAIQYRATPTEPTEADFADLYKRAKAAGITGGQSEAQFRQALSQQAQNLQLVETNLGFRNIYMDGIKRANVAVNPRYGSEVVLLKDNAGHALVVLPLNSKPHSSAVVARS